MESSPRTVVTVGQPREAIDTDSGTNKGEKLTQMENKPSRFARFFRNVGRRFRTLWHHGTTQLLPSIATIETPTVVHEERPEMTMATAKQENKDHLDVLLNKEEIACEIDLSNASKRGSMEPERRFGEERLFIEHIRSQLTEHSLEQSWVTTRRQAKIDRELANVKQLRMTERIRCMNVNLPDYILTQGAILVENEMEIYKKHGYSVSRKELSRSDNFVTYRARHAKDITTDRPFSARVLTLDNMPQENTQYLRKYGLKILKFAGSRHHSSLPLVFNIFDTGGSKIYIFEEFLSPQHLGQIVAETAPISEHKARTWTKQVALGLDYLHDIGISHQNLSICNIYFTPDEQLKITGLEFAFIYWDTLKQKIIQQQKRQAQASPITPPEVASGDLYDPTKADIWAFGVLLATILLNRYPYLPDAEEDFTAQWGKAREDILNVLSNDGYCLLCSCLQMDAESRCDTKDILHHPWFNVYVELS